MKIIIKEGEKDDSVRKTFECIDCGCVFTSNKDTFYSTCPWCHSECAYEKKE